MTRSLAISPKLSLPVEAVTSTFGLLAVRGAGKSNAGAVMAEEMFAAGLPFVAIDPVGAWPGLRSGADGSPGGGLPIPIFGGRHGDVPLERGAGELIADLIAEQRLSCVLDLSRFPSEGDKKTFLLAFARRIYEKNQDPLHLFLEEADDYIPQKPIRDEVQLLRAWENIVRRGRGRGLGMTLITQRSAVVAKNVLTQVETLFVLRTTGPQDIAAIEAWVKYHQVGTEMLSTLAGLEDGEAWVWSPHFLRKMERFRFRQRRTFDTGATPKNVRGKDARKVATLADVDLGEIQTKMAATIEKAKGEDPKALRAANAAKDRRIAELEKELSQKAAEPVEVPVAVFDRPAFTKTKEDVVTALMTARDSICSALDGYRVLLIGSDQYPAERRPSLPHPTEPREPIKVDRAAFLRPERGTVPACRAPVVHRDTKPDDVHLGTGERAILTAIAQHPDGVTREQLTVLTGYKRSSRDTYLQRLKAADLCGQEGDRLLVTDVGMGVLGDGFEPLPTGRALLEHWLAKLPEGERKILEVVARAYPKSVERAQIDDATGYKRSSRDTYLQRLGARRIVVSDGRGAVRMSEELA